MDFIELHYDGRPRLIAIKSISMIGRDAEDTFVLLCGNHYRVYVDESYDEIKHKMQEVGFVWSV